jgi:hypothetical protein
MTVAGLSRLWSFNPYQYAEQNPLMFWDADGCQPWPFEIYTSLEAARVNASSDIMIRFINSGVEHKTRIYRDEDDSYFYAEPWSGTQDIPTCESHAVEGAPILTRATFPRGRAGRRRARPSEVCLLLGPGSEQRCT